jgi:hypothetical protein
MTDYKRFKVSGFASLEDMVRFQRMAQFESITIKVASGKRLTLGVDASSKETIEAFAKHLKLDGLSVTLDTQYLGPCGPSVSSFSR